MFKLSLEYQRSWSFIKQGSRGRGNKSYKRADFRSRRVNEKNNQKGLEG